MSQWSQAFRHLLLGVPGIDTGEIVVLPTERRDVLAAVVDQIDFMFRTMFAELQQRAFDDD